jgi:hypothetical protein
VRVVRGHERARNSSHPTIDTHHRRSLAGLSTISALHTVIPDSDGHRSRSMWLRATAYALGEARTAQDTFKQRWAQDTFKQDTFKQRLGETSHPRRDKKDRREAAGATAEVFRPWLTKE